MTTEKIIPDDRFKAGEYAKYGDLLCFITEIGEHAAMVEFLPEGTSDGCIPVESLERVDSPLQYATCKIHENRKKIRDFTTKLGEANTALKTWHKAYEAIMEAEKTKGATKK